MVHMELGRLTGHPGTFTRHCFSIMLRFVITSKFEEIHRSQIFGFLIQACHLHFRSIEWHTWSFQTRSERRGWGKLYRRSSRQWLSGEQRWSLESTTDLDRPHFRGDATYKWLRYLTCWNSHYRWLLRCNRWGRWPRCWSRGLGGLCYKGI